MRFGAQKSFIRIKRKEWRIFGFSDKVNGYVPKNEITDRLAEANLIILGKEGFLNLPKDVDSRVDFILAWSRKVPIVDDKFISDSPLSFDISGHLVTLPFSNDRLRGRSFRTNHPKGDQLVKEFGGEVSKSSFVEVNQLLDYLYFISDKLQVEKCLK